MNIARKLVTVMSSNLRYFQRVKALFGANLIAYWPLWEASGLVASDVSGNARDAVYPATGLTFGNAGIGDGRTCPNFTAAYVNIKNASLAAAFSGAEGSAMIWFRVNSAAQWSDATIRYAFQVAADGNNRIRIMKDSTSNLINFIYKSGGTEKQVNYSTSSTGWLHLALTWSKSNNRMRAYINGSQTGANQTGLADWVGSIDNVQTLLAANTLALGNPMVGYLAHALITSREPTAEEVGIVASPFDITRYFAIGDSKTAAYPNWWTALNELMPTVNHNWITSPAIFATSGWTTQQAKDGIDAGLADRSGTPARIMINLGANDISLGSAPNEPVWKANTTYIVDALRARWPGVPVYLTHAWVRNLDAESATMKTYREAVIATYASGVYAGPDEAVVIKAGDNGAAYLTDDKHPNAAGCAAMASAWKTLLGY